MKIMGALLIALPFVALSMLMVSYGYWQELLTAWVIAILVIACVFGGIHLFFRS